MANVIDYVLDVLATSPDEIGRIAVRLKQPSADLLDWVAKQANSTPDEMAQSVSELVSFEAVENLFDPGESVNKARRFTNSFRKFTGTVNSHIFEVSAEFPHAVFLLEDYDMQWSYSRKRVIYAGQVLQKIVDGNHQSQAQDWVLLDIFAPFRAEWMEGLGVGSLWPKWVRDVAVASGELLKTGLPDEVLDGGRNLILNQKPDA
jgi:hypothetical protein